MDLPSNHVLTMDLQSKPCMKHGFTIKGTCIKTMGSCDCVKRDIENLLTHPPDKKETAVSFDLCHMI